MREWLTRGRIYPILLVILSILLIAGLHIRGIPALSAEGSSYQNLKKFTEILDLVERNYVEEVDAGKLMQGAIEGLMKTLDPHSTYMTEEMYKELQVDTKGVFGGLGIVISIRNDVLTVVAPLEDTPAFKAGILAGDEIVTISGEDTKGISIMEAVRKLRGPKGTDVTISIMRKGLDLPREYTLTRDIIKIQSVRHRLLPDNIGYVRISSFQENTSDDLRAALRAVATQTPSLRGIILDLRNNPGGLLDQAVSAADLFLRSGVIVSTKGRTDRGRENVYRARAFGTEPEVPIIILVNGGSASGSEILAGALRDNERALLLGTQTFGKGVMQMIIPLRDGSAIKLTTAKYYTPSGTSIQATGLTPDFVVEYRRPDSAPEDAPAPRERDLEGHMQGDPRHDDVPPEGPREIHFYNLEDLELDNQVQRAMELLKNWDLFKKI